MQVEIERGLAADTSLPGIVVTVHAPRIGLAWSGACGALASSGDAAAQRLMPAHVFRIDTASAVRRCAALPSASGTIEHGTLIDDDTARFVAEKGVYIVPTVATFFALTEAGRELGFPPESQAKMAEVFGSALSGMDAMRRAGVKVCFGTDLLGASYTQQCRKFTLRSEVFTALEILRQVTSVTAEMMMQGQTGGIAPGTLADLIVVDGDPLKDISLLAADGRHLRAIVRGGGVVKNEPT